MEKNNEHDGPAERRMPCVAQGACATLRSKLRYEARAAERRRAKLSMYYVYFLRSLRNPAKTYVGMTADIYDRLQKHNEGGCPSTCKFRPWEVIAWIAVLSQSKAAELEQYFKTGSGHAFWHKRFLE